MPAAPSPLDFEPSHRGRMGDLAWARWEHPSQRGRVALSHGYGEHGERYKHTAHWLHNSGWSVSAMDHKGFGRSGGIRGNAEGIRGFAEDFAAFLRQERSLDGAGPLVVLGHSFGGLVALLALLHHPESMDGAILSNPALALPPKSLPVRTLLGLLRAFAPHLPIPMPGDKSRVCSDPLLVGRYRKDPLCHRRITAAYVDAMQEGRALLLQRGRDLAKPILLLNSSDDKIIDNHASEAFWTQVPEGLLERHWLPAFKHEIFHDLLRDEAQALALEWLHRLNRHWKPDAPSHQM